MFTQIADWLEKLIERFGPLGIGFATFVESFFTPLPSEVILVAGGAALNHIDELAIYIVAATLGAYLGTLPFYIIGYKSRNFVLKIVGKYGKWVLTDLEDIEKAEEKFKKRGEIIIFTGRMIPGLRSLISIPAGISRIDFKLYTTYTLLGSLCWNTLLMTLGYVFKDQYWQILELLDRYQKFALGIIAIAILLYLGKKFIYDRGLISLPKLTKEIE